MTYSRKNIYIVVTLSTILLGMCLALFTAPALAVDPNQTVSTPSGQNEHESQKGGQTSVPVLTTGDKTTEGTPADSQSATTEEPVLPEGNYIIQSSLPGRAMIDVAAGSKKNGGNVWLYGYNKTPAQRWKLSVDSDGLYTITNEKSGMVLDISHGKVRNGQNIWQYLRNDTPAQKWRIVKDGIGFVIHSAKDERFVIDAAAGKSANKTNVQLYKANGTSAQRWWIIPEKPTVVSKQVLSDGIYEIAFTKDKQYVIDLSAQSFANAAKIQLYKRNNTLAQRWALTWEKDGYYSLRNVSSGKPLDVTGGAYAARTTLQQYISNDTDAQRWAIEKNSDGSYTLISKLNGLALDIHNARASNGAQLQMFMPTGGASQKLSFTACDILPQATYSLYSLLAPTTHVLDVPAGSKADGVQLQLYKANNTMAQKYLFRRIGVNTYAIQNVYSGKYLEESNGKIVQQKRLTARDAQHWVASFERNGIALTNATTLNRFALASTKATNTTKVVSAGAKNTNAQHWRLTDVSQLIPNATYTITNAKGNVVDVAAASVVNGANIQVYKANNTGAQKFAIAPVGSGYYKIINRLSDKAVEVKNGSKADGANVDQASYSGAARQLWKPTLREDGLFTFVNKASGKALDVAAGSTRSGANVQSYTTNGTEAQGWTLTATKYVPPTPKKAIYLTFDDGPGQHTARLLKILDKYNVKATFFVTHQDPRYLYNIGNAAKAGHAIGVHSYTHAFYSVYASSDAYWRDFERMQADIVKQTGSRTNLFRFPGGSSNTISRFNPGIMTRLVAESKKKGYYYFDWNVGGIDAGGTTSSSVVLNDAIRGIRNTNQAVVLLHDTKGYTVDAVEGIIKWGLANGYTFLPLTESSPGAHQGLQN